MVESDDTASSGCTAARAFEVVWDTLVGVLGAAATATLFRRAARSAARNRPELGELRGFDITRDGLDYGFLLPDAWSSDGEACMEAVRHLVREELCPLLEELTGPVLVGMLEREPELQRLGVKVRRGEAG